MDISPTSFSITTMRLPWSDDRIRFTSVVFPLPRKPVTIVTGVLLKKKRQHLLAGVASRQTALLVVFLQRVVVMSGAGCGEPMAGRESQRGRGEACNLAKERGLLRHDCGLRLASPAVAAAFASRATLAHK
jgi:hypothetical protein